MTNENNEQQFDDLSEEAMDEILASGDTDKIDALLDSLNSDEDSATSSAELENEKHQLEKENENEKELDKEIDQKKADDKTKAEDDQNAEDDAEQTAEIAGIKYVVKAKDGVHEIPFDVVESLRSKVSELSEELNLTSESQNKAKELVEKLTRKNELLSGQLENNQIHPDELPEDIEISDELIEHAVELDPKLGLIVKALTARNDKLEKAVANKINAQETQTPNTQVDEDPVIAAINRNPTMKNWRESSVERWDMVQKLDAVVQKDPAFAKKSVDEQFNEIVRRVNLAYGDSPAKTETDPENKTATDGGSGKSAEEIAAEKLAKAQASTPTSLTDVGQTSNADRSLAERLSDKSPSEISDYIAENNLSTEQIDELLASTG